MTKRTKRALVSSALALLLCFTMLLGTTYAWFTDSVTTVNNKIVAGNLDIELESAKQPATGTALTWTTVDANTNIFETGTLWEPGHVEVAYLWAKNVGTLALEWDLAINIYNEVTSTSVLGNDLVLSSYLKAQLVEIDATAPVAYANRAAAKAAVTAGYGLTSYTGNGVLKAGETKAYALIVYMPEEVGNEANYAKGKAVPQIDMGITLLATQTPYENDSFGKDYDEGATYPAVANTAATLNAALANGGGIVLGNDVNLTEMVAVNKAATIDLAGKTLTAEEVDGYDDVLQVLADVTLENGTVKSDTGYAAFVGNKTGDAGKLTVKSGTYIGDTTAIQVSEGELVITGGYFEVKPYNDGGDPYRYTINCLDDPYRAGTAKVTVIGGTFFNFNPADNASESAHTNYVPAGYTVVAEPDGNGNTLYTVVAE